MDEYTADAWHDVLATEPWLTLDQARAAVIEIKRRQPFVDVSEILTQARRQHAMAIGHQHRNALTAPVAQRLRDPLKDARPLRETIRELVADAWPDRPALPAGTSN